jgi:tight adherence protein B
MPPDTEQYLGSIAVSLAVALLVFFGREHYTQVMNSVEGDLAEKLRRLRVPTTRLRRYLNLWVIATLCTFLTFWLLLDSLIFAVLFPLFLLTAPWYLVRRMAERRKQKIEDQLADAMVGLANAVRAGLSLAQSLEILAAQCPAPINSEFRQIVGEYKLGKPLQQTLLTAKERLKSENFALFAAAMLASHESGGRLNETVERIAQSVLELQRLERKVESETAQARKSAIYMAMAPMFILVGYYFVDPVNTSLLFTETIGHFVLAVAVVLNVAAYVWARTLLNPEI